MHVSAMTTCAVAAVDGWRAPYCEVHQGAIGHSPFRVGTEQSIFEVSPMNAPAERGGGAQQYNHSRDAGPGSWKIRGSHFPDGV